MLQETVLQPALHAPDPPVHWRQAHLRPHLSEHERAPGQHESGGPAEDEGGSRLATERAGPATTAEAASEEEEVIIKTEWTLCLKPPPFPGVRLRNLRIRLRGAKPFVS